MTYSIQLTGAVDASATVTPGRSSTLAPTEARLSAALQTIRDRATAAAASAGDVDRNQPFSRSITVCGTGRSLSTPADLEAALEASEISDVDLEGLAAALTAIAKASYNRFRRSATRTREARRRTAWAALTRALIRPWRLRPPMSSTGRNSRGVNLESRESSLREWNGLRLPLKCKRLLLPGGDSGGDVQVTSLTYLPLAMLLASGYADGKVRLWDPCARRHKLAPPPPLPAGKRQRGGLIDGGESVSLGEWRRQGGEGNGRGRHLRICPGTYVDTPEEWTTTGQTFGCVAVFGAVSLTAGFNGYGDSDGSKRGGGDGGGGSDRSMKICAIDAIVVPGDGGGGGFSCGGGGDSSLIVCDAEGARVAREMDDELPWDPASTGEISCLSHASISNF